MIFIINICRYYWIIIPIICFYYKWGLSYLVYYKWPGVYLVWSITNGLGSILFGLLQMAWGLSYLVYYKWPGVYILFGLLQMAWGLYLIWSITNGLGSISYLVYCNRGLHLAWKCSLLYYKWYLHLVQSCSVNKDNFSF